MQFGRTVDISKINFSLPDDNTSTIEMFNTLVPAKIAPKIYVGCPVWADKGYVGKIYPPKAKSKDYLYHYCRQFNAIEVNVTHYNIPTDIQIQRWKEAATPGFKFSPKFPQLISHSKGLNNNSFILDSFLSAIYELREFLGTSFLQLPPYFKPSEINELTAFLEGLPRDFDIAVELRHEDWFNNESIKKDLYDLFRGLDKVLLITDTAGRRDVLHQILTTDKVFVRFVGDNLDPSDFSRIDAWVERIKLWTERGVNTIYFYVHEPDKSLCAELVLYMIRSLNKKLSLKLSPPKILSQQQKTLFE